MQRLVKEHPALRIALEYDPRSMWSLGYSPHELLEVVSEMGFGTFALSRRGELSPFDAATSEVNEKDGTYQDLILSREALLV
jgi:hypothetical protein